MANQITETKQEKDEFSRIFNDYRTRLDEITRQMQKNLGFDIPDPLPPEAAPENIVAEVQLKAEPEPGELFPQAQEEPEIKAAPNPGPELELVPVKESEEIIREARRRASRIISEAEKRVKDESKKKTELQVNKIITQAQKEAQDIVARARQSAEEQKTAAINAMKQEAQQSLSEIVEKCRLEAREHSSAIIRESRDKAAKMINDILAAGKEMSLMLEEAVTATGNTINDFETRIKSGNETLLKAISQSQNKFLLITNSLNEEKAEEKKAEPEPQNKHRDSRKNPALAIHLLSNGNAAGREGFFRGKMEVRSVSSAIDYAYLKNLKKYLLHFPSVKYLQESASEKAVTMLFDVTEPLPLPNVLHDIPSIDEVIFENQDNIWLSFKDSDQP